jgi:O-acetyl-ADP-ribose deacetylase (regulator of RNase III)
MNREVSKEIKAIGKVKRGDCVSTYSGKLMFAWHIIHAVGPVWSKVIPLLNISEFQKPAGTKQD